MGQGLGKLQLAILDHLQKRQGGDTVRAHYQMQVQLAPGIHDMRVVAREMNEDDRGFSDRRRQAAFSRAVASLIERDLLRACPLVPITKSNPDGQWQSRVLQLSDGCYLDPPSGSKWRRRFVGMN
jgi:hypothetical protein